jgi:hypothetical protein
MPFGKVLPVIGLNLGFIGSFTRGGNRTVSARQVLSTTATPLQFGQSTIIVPDQLGGTFQSVFDFITGGGTMTAALFAGIATRNVTTGGSFPYNPDVPTIGSYLPGNIGEVGQWGSMLVPINVGSGSAEATSKVFMRIAANGAFPLGVLGGFEGVADGSNTIDLSTVGVVFTTGVVDANGNMEITMKTRVAA